MTETIPLGWAYLPVAFALGGLHFLEPGHGKALASAYLVSGKHDWKDAVVLGLSTTASHTSLVIVLAAASLWAQGHYPAAQIELHVRQFGAWALLLLGAYSCVGAIRGLRHGHHHGHGHGHGHAHGQPSGPADSLWAVALIGFGNGITPCPGALAALGVALSLGQVALGLVTVLVYAAGMALSLILLSLLIIEAGQRAQRWLPSDRAALWLPLISGVLVTLTGLWLLAGPSGAH
jgi:ABC-type nickel/cobalt efflux system permease component RcnA